MCTTYNHRNLVLKLAYNTEFIRPKFCKRCENLYKKLTYCIIIVLSIEQDGPRFALCVFISKFVVGYFKIFHT